MKLVFVHDGPLFYDENGNYYEFAYHELLQRYSYLADEISFLMRIKPITKKRKFTLVPKDIKVVSVPDFKSIKNIRKRKDASEIIEATIKENDYVVFRLQSSIAQIGIKYAKKHKKPYIIESVGCPWDSYWNHSLLGKFVAPFSYLETKKAIYEAEYVYYVTKEFLQRRYPTQGYSVSCSNVVLEKLDDNILENRFKKIDKMRKGRPVTIGTAAALDVRYKGQEYVIRAIARLNKEGYNFVYKLAGGFTGQKENNYLSYIAKQCDVEKNVIFEGSLPASKMNDYYDSLDLYVQPSKQEGLPRAVIEAMSRGCPCIGTNIAGIPELIRGDLMFKKGNVKAVEQALMHICKSDLKNIAQQNFEKAREYEKEKLEKKRASFYNDFLERYKIYRGGSL